MPDATALALPSGARYVLPQMRLLDRYLLRELLIPLAFCLGGFLVFWIAFELFNELPTLQAAHLTGVEVVEYYACKLPELLAFPIVPVALLLALLYTLTTLARHHELTAMRAAGVSLARLSIPYLVVGFLLSLGLLLLNEVYAPNSAAIAQEMLKRHADQRPDAAEREWQPNLNFNNEAAGRIWTIGKYNLKTSAMINPMVEWQSPDRTVRRVLARSGLLTNGVWTFYDAQVFLYEPPAYDVPRPQSTNVLAVPEFNETPELIRSEIKITGMSREKAAKRIRFTLSEILNYERLHPHLGPEMYAMLNTQLHGRLAQPWISLVVVVIAIPFGALSGRRNVVVGVASSIFICFAYFIVSSLGLYLGTGMHLTPWLAAWLPNLLFAAGGLWFTLRVR